MPEFFLELLSEEIPARMQAAAADELLSIISAFFGELAVRSIDTFRGPRRLAVATEVKAEKRGGMVEARGPRETAPEAALNGFLHKHGACRAELATAGGYYWLRREIAAVPVRQLMETGLSAALQKFSWPKAMRWGQSRDLTWVRPLRRIVCLLDGEVVPIRLGPVVAGNTTEGHRTLAPNAITVSSWRDWREKLPAHYVLVEDDSGALCSQIRQCLDDEAAKHRLKIVGDAALLGEVTGLVEWPVPLIGRIEPLFMDLPPEVRELSMKVNQKYFALRDAAGKPAPYFAFVANLQAPDGGAAIIAGNERVLRARLADARHFWELDLKTPLNELLPKLDGIVFHAKIGTQRERAERIAALAERIAGQLGGEGDAARWAGLLCKADLVTGMVGEFPELQGVMGGYYAEKNPRGWDGGAVGPAIRTHYQPRGPNDPAPRGSVAVSVALADKIDTLVRFFRIGEAPGGSGDPYALRRAALGVIRIILENELRLPLRPWLGGDEKLFGFIIERLRVKLRGEGRRFDVLDAVLGAGSDDDLLRVMQRVSAVTTFLETPDGMNLLTAYRRSANILRIENAKDGPHGNAEITVLATAEERGLSQALADVKRETATHFIEGRYEQAMTILARLRAPVDEFFDKVTVNAPEPELRLNRLRLLLHLRDMMHGVADFSKIES